MNVEIHGAGFLNKGAQLMLLTVIKRLRAAQPDIRCAVDPAASRPYPKRAAYELYQMFPPHQWQYRIPALRPFNGMVPKRLCELYGLVPRSQSDALIDISGYAYGDGWGSKAALSLISRAGDYRRRGKPVIMLPQMLGPFQKAGAAETFRRVLDQVNLVYARERVSLEHAREVKGRQDNLRMAPDITIFMETGKSRVLPFQERAYACLVPNCRMLDQGKQAWGEIYMERLVAAGKHMLQSGLQVKVVVHDATDADEALGRDLVERLAATGANQKCELVMEPDPLRLKALLGDARLIVASRFHSIVSALSCGVPAIALGWSHKYQMLMEDFSVADLIHKSEYPLEHLLNLITHLGDQEQWTQRHATLLAAKASMRDANTQMWDEVFALLKIKSPANHETAAPPRDSVVAGNDVL